ncbi:uncharacterized protein [Haliotis cracherodii]|uniref:uncharacterized protein n=1 Tax=Haliotis cracherodii TaxID=6455 RepID=UPI0039EB4953
MYDVHVSDTSLSTGLGGSNVLDSMNFVSSSNVLGSMNLASSSNVLDSMNFVSSSIVLDSMNLVSSSNVLDSMNLVSSSELLDSMNLRSSNVVVDTNIVSSSGVVGTPSVATHSDGQTLDSNINHSMHSSVGASLSSISATDIVSSVFVMSVNSMATGSVLPSMSGLSLLTSTSVPNSLHASMVSSSVQTSAVVISQTIGLAVSSMDDSMVTMATGNAHTSMLGASATISTPYNSMDGSMVTMVTGDAQASMIHASNTAFSSMDGSMATVDAQTGLTGATASTSTPFNSQSVSVVTMVTGDAQTSMVDGGMASTTSGDTQFITMDASSTLATAVNGMDGSAGASTGTASLGGSGAATLATDMSVSASMASGLGGGTVVNSMVMTSTSGFVDATTSPAADSTNTVIPSVSSDSSLATDGLSTSASTGILPSTAAASIVGLTTGGGMQASLTTATVAPSSTQAVEASSAVIPTTPTTTTATTSPTTTTTTTRAPVITMDNPPALLHTETSVSCTLEGEGWSLVGFFQFFQGQFRAIAGFTSDGNNNVFLSQGLSSSRYNDTNTTTFIITFDNITCQQDTTYLCAANFATASINDFGRLKVTLPPQPPIVTYPGDIQENARVTLTCEATVIATDGDLYWAIKRPGETTFLRYDFPDDTRAESSGDCTKTITHTLTTTFNTSFNGTEVRCQSSNPDDVSSSKTLLIVPSNLCDPYPANSLVTHPYDCNKYITCIPGARLTQSCPGTLCFDQGIRQCVENTSNQGTADNDPFSCDGKTNGAYIPWRDSCTKYAWCVNGQPIEQTCATGTFYTQFVGPCTFDKVSAFCDESQLV